MSSIQKFLLSTTIALLAVFCSGLCADDESTARSDSAEFAYALWIRQSSDDAFALAHSEATRSIILQHVVGNHFLYGARTHSEVKDLKSDAEVDSFFGRSDIRKSLLTVNTSDPLQLLPKYIVDSEGNSVIYTGLLPNVSGAITDVLENKVRYEALALEYQNFLRR